MRQCPKCSKRFLENNARICDVDGAVLDLLIVASERDRLIGTTILNRYAVDGVLGDGGMGVVYRALDTGTGRRFAVKVLRAEYSAEEELVVRFEQEARAAAAVHNPHIVEIYDWGSLPDNSRFFVMEYLEGKSLGDVLARRPKPPGADRRTPMPEDFAIHIAMQVAEGLAAAHAIGVVHRDIKPDNFHLVRRGDDPYFVKILDFGIAKVQNSKAARTRTGSVFGTPHYMSPEQASGDRNMDAATDIYGLGVLMYEMVAGKVPFDADNLMGILTAHLYHTPVPPRAFPECAALSPSIEAVILKCLAKTREGRYASMEALHADLARIRDGQTATALDDQECSTVRFSRADLALPESADDANTRPDVRMPEAALPEAFSPLSAPAALGSGARGNGFSAPPSTPPSILVDTGAAMALPTRATLPTPRRSRLALVAGVVCVGVFIGLGIVGLTSLHDATAPAAVRATSVPALAPVPAPALVPVPPVVAPAMPVAQHISPAPSAPVLAPAPVPVPPAAPPAAVSPHSPVLLETDAAGARVLRGGREIGALPIEVPRPSSGQDTYDIDAPGYDRTQVQVGAASPRVLRVVLGRHVRTVRTGRHDHGAAAPPHGHVSGEIHDPWAQ